MFARSRLKMAQDKKEKIQKIIETMTEHMVSGTEQCSFYYDSCNEARGGVRLLDSDSLETLKGWLKENKIPFTCHETQDGYRDYEYFLKFPCLKDTLIQNCHAANGTMDNSCFHPTFY